MVGEAENAIEKKERKRLPVVDESLEQRRNVLWRNFLTAHAAVIDRIEDDLDEAEVLPLSWYDVLLALYEAPEHKLRMHELARAILVTRGGLTRLVARIERAGLLRREPDRADGRGLYAALADEGLEALRTTWPVYARGIAEHFGRHLSDEEVEVLDRAFNRVSAAAQER
ncbi:MAG: MarR family transcriptional regulator [Actinomycetota bacterium]|nr:MarR family transcriptional regulator [Rubrobacteraceae bacterium]MDQ3498802.1 MarR family transcriptional regulator [Actinomycetota bacterium]